MRFYQCPLSARFGGALMTVLGRKAVGPLAAQLQPFRFRGCYLGSWELVGRAIMLKP